MSRRRLSGAMLALPLAATARQALALDVSRLATGLAAAPVALAFSGKDLLLGGSSGLWTVGQTGGRTDGRLERPKWPASDQPISALAAAGDLIATAGPAGIRLVDRTRNREVWVSGAVPSPRGIALSADGTVIAADVRAGHVLRIDGARVTQLAAGLRGPVGVFVDGDSDVWVTEFAAGRITYLNLKTGAARPLVFALNGPTAVARLNTGNLAVVEPGLGRILTVDPKTGERTPLAGGLALAVDDLDLPPDSAAGLAVNDKDVVFAACPGDHSIVRIVPEVRRERDKT